MGIMGHWPQRSGLDEEELGVQTLAENKEVEYLYL